MLLGLLVNRQGRLPGLPRFAVTGLHRNISLIAVVFVCIHVLTAVADTYVSVPLTSAVVPFASGYERLWLGFGAISLDLMIAMIVTSLLRGHLSYRLWRAVHWLAYLSWPVALAHSIGSSTDMQKGPLLDLAVACAILVAIGLIWRVAATARSLPRARRVSALMPGPSGPRQSGPTPSATHDKTPPLTKAGPR
jgi:predicted ferric reductase